MIDVAIFTCRVCGLVTPEFAPWGSDGQHPSYEFCDCCGVQFGYEDCLPSSIQNYRQKWLANGAVWFKPDKKPAGWSLEEQLKSIES
jgi:hypothetical protein